MSQTENGDTQIMEMLISLQAQVTGLTTTVRALIESHPDRGAVDLILERQKFRLEALLGPTSAPDTAISGVINILNDMQTIARRNPEVP